MGSRKKSNKKTKSLQNNTKIQKSRKELRKEQRGEKKLKRKYFFEHKKELKNSYKNNGKFNKHKTLKLNTCKNQKNLIKTNCELSDQSIEATISVKNKTKEVKRNTKNILEDDQQRVLKQQQKIEKDVRKQRIKQLKLANEEDDRIINQLEKRLKIDKFKNKNQIPKMFNDGLDYAMEFCMPENSDKIFSKDAHSLKEWGHDNDDLHDDFEFIFGENGNEKIKTMPQKLKKKASKDIEIDSESNYSSNSNIHDEDVSDMDDEVDDYNIHIENDNDEDENTDMHEKVEEKKSDIWEDIYGRKRDKDGNIVQVKTNIKDKTKYVPPHVRRQIEAQNNSNNNSNDTKHKEKLLRLHKQLKGYLNRLSETNMHKISNDIEKLYMQNSRFDMNTTLTELILDALISNVISPERLILEHIMLIAVLHANVGNEIGAHFLQIVIEKYANLYEKMEQFDVENKEFDNIILIICHLYTFKIFQHNLIYEILNKLIIKLNEKSVECVLLILRSIGFSLRKDDPLALKTFINAIQRRSNDVSDELKNNSRLNYMLDVLLAIKNNNVNKIPQYDSSLPEHLRKILKTLLINGKYVTTINITLDDLLKVDEHGKWWIVGSAWSGNIKDINSSGDNNADIKIDGSSMKMKEKLSVNQFSQQLLDLAKKQRMNTDDRKNAFCIIVSSDDYLEAFEKLLHLSIKDHNTIISIIIHCCLSEKIFNPYYVVLTQKFCDFNRKYQLAVQFLIWDRIKDIKSLTNIQLKNMAHFLIKLIEMGGLALSVLKIIEFSELDKITLRLVRQIMIGILMINDEDACKQIFNRISPSTKLKGFKDSIRIFMHHFLINDDAKKSMEKQDKKDEYNLLKKRVDLADYALETIDTRITL